MKYLWKSLDIIEKRLKSSARVLLLLDYDGTLSKIATTPQKAVFPQKTKVLLEKLTLTKQITVGIVSGRAISDIKKHVGISHIIYAGNHGLEWEIDGTTHVVPQINKALAMYIPILSGIKAFEGQYKGVYIEDKKLTISVHYRLLDKKSYPAFSRAFHFFIQPYLDSSRVKLIKGKKVYDVKPNIEWGKGGFVNWLIKRRKNPTLTIYIGDDKTDEDVFATLKNAITVKVGKSKSEASYYLKNPADTLRFLEWMLERSTWVWNRTSP